MIIMSNMTGTSSNIVKNGGLGGGYGKNSSTGLLNESDEVGGSGGVDVTTTFYLFTLVYIIVFVTGFIIMVCFIHWYLRRQSYLQQTSLLEAESLCSEVGPKIATTSDVTTTVSDSLENGEGWVSFVWSRRLRILLPGSLKTGVGVNMTSASSASVTTMGRSQSFKSRKGRNVSKRRFSAIQEEDGLAREGDEQESIC
eukprot:1732422-Rhodomonas_salina.2